MKMSTGPEGNVLLSEGLEEVECTIEASPLAFEILSGGLYSDRVLAIVRELSANAVDAHVEAGTSDIPYVIHAPNYLEPFFSIRDYGTGLSPELVAKLYTRYFKSTKTQRNDEIGCMGLGSKTPFSYVDSFTVTSYWNGVKYMFNAYKNSARKPCVTLLDQTKTAEPNGLEVSMAVQRSDFNQFTTKIRDALRFFKKQPTVVGEKDFEFHENKYIVQTEEFGVLKGDSLVIMGGLSYPLETDTFYNTSTPLTNPEKRLIDHGLHIYVPIGAVHIAASREQLTYTEETRQTLKKFIEKALWVVKEEIEKEFTNAQSIWDARKIYSKIKSTGLTEIVGDDIVWQNQEVNDVITNQYFSDLWPAKVELLSFDKDDRTNRRRSRRGRYYSTPVNDDSLMRKKVEQFSINRCLAVFVNDLAHGGLARARHYMKTHDLKCSMMISTDISNEFINAVGFRHLILQTSALPKPPRKEREKSAGGVQEKKSFIQLFDGFDFNDVEDLDLSKGGIYVEVKHDRVRLSKSDEFSDPSKLGYIYNQFNTLGVELNIYGIRPSNLGRLGKHADQWTPLYTEYLERFLKANPQLAEKAKLSLTYERVEYIRMRCNQFRNLPAIKNSIIDDILGMIDECYQAKHDDKVQAFIDLNKNCYVYDLVPDQTIVDLCDSIEERYPLLGFVSQWNDGSIDHICEYIQMVEEKLSKIPEEAAA